MVCFDKAAQMEDGTIVKRYVSPYSGGFKLSGSSQRWAELGVKYAMLHIAAKNFNVPEDEHKRLKKFVDVVKGIHNHMWRYIACSMVVIESYDMYLIMTTSAVHICVLHACSCLPFVDEPCRLHAPCWKCCLISARCTAVLPSNIYMKLHFKASIEPCTCRRRVLTANKDLRYWCEEYWVAKNKRELQRAMMLKEKFTNLYQCASAPWRRPM